jgi:hypothetical protein
MPFQRDERYAAEIGRIFGDYLTTYASEGGQVRAYLFRKGDRVDAHVSFRRGLFARDVTDPYVTDLWQYAREHEFADQFQLILS